MAKNIIFRGCPGMASNHMIINETNPNNPTQDDDCKNEIADFEVNSECMINIWQDLFCIVTMDGKFQKVSQAWESILGFKEEEMEGKNYMELIHPEDIDSAMKHMTAMSQGGKTINFINRFQHKDGSYKWFEWRAVAGEDKNLIFAVAREVSQYKAIENEISHKTWALNERLKEMNCLYAVTNSLQDINSSPEKVIPKLFHPIINAYQYPQITAVKIVVEGIVFTSDNYTESEWKQSSIIHVSEQEGGIIEVSYLEKMPMFDEGPFLKEERTLIDSLANLIGQFISRSASYRQTLLLASVMDVSIDAIGTFRFDGTILSWSKGAERLYGLTAKEIIGGNIASINPKNTKQDLEDFVSQLKEGKSIEGFETQRIKPDGTILDVFVAMTPIKNAEGVYDSFITILHDISERKQQERKLQQSEAQFRLLAENITDVIWTLDINGKFLYVSPSVEKLRGYTPEEVMQQNMLEALTPSSSEKALALLGISIPLILGGERPPPETMILEHTCKGGTTVWTEVSVSSIFDDAGKFLFFLGVTRDITARRNLEKERDQEHILLKTLIDNFPSSIWFFDKDFRKTIVNNLHLKRVAKTLGRDTITEEEIIGKTNFEVYTGEIASEYLNQDKSVLRDGNVILNFEACTKGENDEPLWESISKLPIHNKEGEILGMLGIANDITERKQAEHLNKLNSDRIAAQYRMSFLEDKSEEEIIAMALEEALKLTQSESGFFHFVDEAQTNLYMTGWSSSVTRNCNNPVSTHYPVTEAGIWAQCIQSHKPFLCNDYQGYPVKKGLPDGHFNLIRFITCPVIENEKVTLVIGVGNKNFPYEEIEAAQLGTFMEEVWKIIKKARLIEELRIAMQKAEESNRLKTSLMLNMSHEFRTPLNGILGFAGLLKDTVNDEDARSMAEYITMSGKRLLVTLTSILELSQLESNKKIINLTEVNLSDLSHNVISKFSELLDFKKLQLSEMIEENLVLHTDQGVVSNIFYYLIDNAIKYTDAGQVWVSLQKTTKNGADYLVFRIRDTGIGISDEQLKFIFEPFRQGSEGIGRRHEGNGLGLTLCKKFLDILGASMEIESRVEMGSTFSVFFSVQPSAEPLKILPEVETKSPGIAITDKKGGAKPRVLVVEDNEINVELIMMYLDDRFIVEKALNGKMALKLASINDYDLILMDINLGSDMDGIEVTREIRKMKKNENLPIIAVTGYATDREKQAILSHGLNDYLSKPFTREELYTVIKRVIA